MHATCHSCGPGLAVVLGVIKETALIAKVDCSIGALDANGGADHRAIVWLRGVADLAILTPRPPIVMAPHRHVEAMLRASRIVHGVEVKQN
eukprot:CAMPEP_0117495222 /NCGR_PEP_ID=MMETSP0784-20121206/20020_1 /TAXON_ID=39447 /ORGANISM="" /LENGTH=90 /DNA_ID=CAMNT_0005290135 /DNA_START=644 /DNA_END=916 /DNA_ORIENTATION=-